MMNSALTRLTLVYLAIIMLISFFFSLILYQTSSHELELHWRRHPEAFALGQGGPSPQGEYTEELTDTRRRLQWDLLEINLAILLLGGGASFFLARHTIKPIENALEAQRRFSADASHELRTPLTAMRTEIEVALREKRLSGSQARELLQSNLEEIRKLETLSAALLRLAQHEDGKGMGFASIELAGVLSEALGRVEKSAKQKGVKLEASKPEGDNPAWGDRESMVELAYILLDNAVKYSPKGTSVSIDCGTSGARSWFSIKDQGIGIDKSDLPLIFERFFRADQSRSKDAVSGYGLGLSIAKKIAELHHGQISVESAPGEGSTFTVRLPKDAPRSGR